MALDRTWYNSLVDDDGSGLTGSVWDKADVNALMNAIDTEIATPRVSGYEWQDYTPTLQVSGGTFTAAALYARHVQSGYLGKTIVYEWSIENATISVGASEVLISIPGAASAWPGSQCTVGALYIGGLQEPALAFIIPGDPYFIHLSRMGSLQFPAGATSVYFRGQMCFRGQ